MHLEKIELSGFKSFAKSTVLEFPSKVTAIVGPNGSGKSNIAEAIRWVLGEQSIKSLRGKKGEDLIWNGSPASPSGKSQVPRMGKASVTLIFDNKEHRIPLDFDEVAISRKIFRDGLNEYYLNDSQVRLKDIVELMARIGLGEQKHNIIGQGEVDKIIMASSRERKEMLEEALGLRIYQLKKRETERKLEATEENMKQVEGLLREIAPHLRFLKIQAQKAEARGSVEAELKEYQRVFLAKEFQEIEAEEHRIEENARPFREKQKKIKKEIENTLLEIIKEEKRFASDEAETNEEEKQIMRREALRRDILRELGRLEGRLEIEKEKASQPKTRVVDTRYIREEIGEVLSEIRSILEEEDRAEVIKSHLLVLVEDLEHLLGEIEKGTAEEEAPGESEITKKLENAIKTLQSELAAIAQEVERIQSEKKTARGENRALQQKIRNLDKALREKQDEERDLAIGLERVKFDEERLRIRRNVWKKESEETGFGVSDLADDVKGFEGILSEDLKRRIERMRAKLEEIGGIDESVVAEYRETEARHAFLGKELEDLKRASVSLKNLVKELEQHIKSDFKAGFAKIKEEFHNYFRIIFGGGRASLQLVKQESPHQNKFDTGQAIINNQEEDSVERRKEKESEPAEEGIEISLDLPRKRIKGLAMLSGGERALTSIALLFSITAVNPPPFLMLDETDAALDEANSQRYSSILKELSKKTQLILITHNRETMKSAGVLYGVTMGDEGISRILSLKFEEAESYTN